MIDDRFELLRDIQCAGPIEHNLTYSERVVLCCLYVCRVSENVDMTILVGRLLQFLQGLGLATAPGSSQRVVMPANSYASDLGTRAGASASWPLAP